MNTLPPKFAEQAGKVRPKGAVNKNTALLKDMILKALEGAGNKLEPGKGGLAYLEDQADKNPVAFMTLVGKVLPMQIAGDPNGSPIVLSIDTGKLSTQALREIAALETGSD